MVTPGETQEFLPEAREEDQKAGEGAILDIETLTSTYREIRLRGTCRDALGVDRVVEDALTDLGEWCTLQADSGVTWRHPDADRFALTLVDRSERKFGREIGSANAGLKAMRRAIASLHGGDQRDDPNIR